jgi:MFS family permease
MSATCITDATAAAIPAPTPATTPSEWSARATAASTPSAGWLALLVSLVITFLAGSSAPTPLYATYQRQWGFSLVMTTVIFGVYALAVLTSLLTVGRLSDHVGRRPVMVTATAAQVVVMLLFADAHGIGALLAGRVLQGLATGAAVGAVGSAMLDISPRLGGLANAAAPGAGTGIGALASGLVVGYLPAPTRTIYVALAAALLIQLVTLTRLPETSPRLPGAVGSLRPGISIPAGVRRAVLAAAPVLFAVWALAGFFGALAPSLLTTLSGSASVVNDGLGFFLLAGTASVATLLLRDTPPRTVLAVGIAAFTLGVAGALASVLAGSAVAFLVSGAVAGVGFGSGFQGALRTVLAVTPAADRAGVLSTVYVVSYLGFGVPAVLAGWLVVHGLPLVHVAVGYTVFLLLLAAGTALTLRQPALEGAVEPSGAAS